MLPLTFAGGSASAGAGGESFLLLETGDFVLLETRDNIILE